ncbi:MAG: putative selenium-dependent hydroxylase accessory protein YqeC [Deltaproteobacteria bacterium]|nr:putative selenium-dependent hydroxylase accessory protein YqeC [Deltaproteobacteria bacterium]
MMADDLISALDLEEKEHIAVVGGGGKTSLMFCLAEQLRLRGSRVVTATTTKIWHREADKSPFIVFSGSDSNWAGDLKYGINNFMHVFVCQRLLPSGKVEGIPAALADQIFLENDVDYLIVEADGAAGHPVKVPADFEPVIPSSATAVVAVMGLEAIGKPLGPDLVFRIEQFIKVTGLGNGDEMTPGVLAGIFNPPDGVFRGSPDTARRIVLLNKLDLVEDTGQATELAELLLGDDRSGISRVLTGSVLKEFFNLYLKRRNNG